MSPVLAPALGIKQRILQCPHPEVHSLVWGEAWPKCRPFQGARGLAALGAPEACGADCLAPRRFMGGGGESCSLIAEGLSTAHFQIFSILQQPL